MRHIKKAGDMRRVCVLHSAKKSLSEVSWRYVDPSIAGKLLSKCGDGYNYIHPKDIKSGHSFQSDLGIDSFDFCEMVYRVEEEFGIDIPDENFGNFQTVRDVADYICSYDHVKNMDLAEVGKKIREVHKERLLLRR